MAIAQNLSNALILACTYMLIAIGLTMVYGVLKVLHIAHAGVYAGGAFAGMIAFSRLQPLFLAALGSAPAAATAAFWISLPVAMIVAGIVGVLIYLGIYRRTWGRSPTVALVAGVGLFMLIEDLLQKPFLLGPRQQPYPAGGAGMPRIETPWFSVTPRQVLILVVTIALLVLVNIVLNRTKVGLAIQAAALDPDMAAAIGVNVPFVIMLSFFIGSALAGAAGVLVGVYDNVIYATMGDVPSYKAFVVVVLGGLGSVPGVVVASLLLAVTETFLVTVAGSLLPRDAIAFLVLILLLMFRPRGLLGQNQ
ncbi:MAG TPA: branched-chain amino acid ABC transporter permease [Anaerolineae bacterium]